MRDRPNWYSETDSERRAHRRGRLRSLRVWLVVVGVAVALLAFNGGPFTRGQSCSTRLQLDQAANAQSVQTSCHQVHSWIP